MSLLRYFHNVTSGIIGRRALDRLPEKQCLQSQLAVATSVLAVAASSVTIVFAHDFMPSDVLFVAVVSLLLFASVVPMYRWLVPRWPGASELANNIIPGSLCLSCGYCAITQGGHLPLSAIYSSAIPLLSVMFCRRPFALLWTVIMVVLLLAGLFARPEVPQSPGWLVLVAGVTVVIPTLVSMLLHRKVWETALENEARALRRLRDQHEEQRSLDRKLSDFERHESLGLMAGRIAHDFNNLLTALIGGTELAKIAIEAGDMGAVSEHLDIIEHAAQNASELSGQLLDYTGKSHKTIVLIDYPQRVRNSITLAQAACPPGTKISVASQGDVWVEGDPTQIDQVLVNLIRNAAQSYEPETGFVAVALNSVETRTEIHCQCPNRVLKPGRYAQLQVTDRGRGIPESRLDHIFEPFSSDRQGGTGLGLAAVSGIVSAHGGGICISSKEGLGTEFSVYLPEAPVPSHDPGDVSVERTDKLAEKTILVADDEEVVRNTISRLVQSLGFDVVSVADGKQAVDRFIDRPLLCGMIMDVSMPVMDGYQTLKEIRSRNTRMPVLLITGYSGVFPDEYRDDVLTELLTKPFSMEDLKEKLCLLGLLRRQHNFDATTELA